MNNIDENPAGDKDTGYRQMPNNLEIEQALLGAILVNNSCVEKVQGFLKEHHFFEPVHGRIYTSCLMLIDKNQSADPIRLKPYYENDPGLDEVGGAAYLVRLAASATTIINAEDYGKIIYDLALRRDLIGVGEEMVLNAYDSPIDDPAEEQIERAEQVLFELSDNGESFGGFQGFGKIINQALVNIEKAWQNPHNVSGVTTGINTIDEMLGGLHHSDLIIIAGRPAMGKTALVTNIAFNAASKYIEDKNAGEDMDKTTGAVVGFFSLEMAADQLSARILAERSGISSSRLRRGMLDANDFHRLTRAAQEIEQTPFFIDDTPALSIAALRTRARRLKRNHNLGIIVIDYLQLLTAKGDNRVEQISTITRGLKSIAKELHVPVLALSQLSRNVESRENKRPQLSDLRESGTIEQDADMVMFVFREEYYKEKEKPPEGTPEYDQWLDEMALLEGKAELIIGKQRHGPTGTMHLNFEGRITKFSDIEQGSMNL